MELNFTDWESNCSQICRDLHGNNLSGDLPDYLGCMTHLQNLNLAQNKFSGSIPTSWGELSNLKHL